MAGESAIYKKFRAEQDAADAAYKKWEQEQWDKNGAEWTKQGYTRTADPNSAWGSTWKKNPVAGGELAPVVKPEEKVELKEPEVKVVPPVVEEAPKFSSYDDIMKQSWARRSHYGANNVWVDENGQKIADHKTHQGKKYQTFVTTGLFGDHNDLTYAYDPETGNVRRLHENWLGNIGDGWSSAGATGVVNNGGWGSLSDMLAQYGITYKKQGGTMNKVKYFAQGGSIKEQLRPLVLGVLSKDPDATLKLEQLVKQNPQIMEIVKEIAAEEQAKAQSQATSAKWGSKLQYIKSLKFAKGGKTCPACMAAGGQTKEKSKTYIAPSDTVHVQGKPKSLVDSQGKKTVKHLPEYTASDYQKDLKNAKKGKKDAANRVEKQDMKTAYGCGGKTGKAKKHQEGGWMELLPFYGTYQSGKRFFKDPSWRGAGEFGMDLAGDALLLTGAGAGAGMAMKAAKAAKAANLVSKTSKVKDAYKAAKTASYLKPTGGYFDEAVNSGRMLLGNEAKKDLATGYYDLSRSIPMDAANGWVASKMLKAPLLLNLE